MRCEGLSPRVRGNHALSIQPNAYAGSIPACAGEPGSLLIRRVTRPVYPRVCGGTGHSLACILIRGVYPRVCGGTVAATRANDSIGGLSPRVRGNPRLRHWQVPSEGSIPACAGEPCRSRSA